MRLGLNKLRLYHILHLTLCVKIQRIMSLADVDPLLVAEEYLQHKQAGVFSHANKTPSMLTERVSWEVTA